MVGGLLHGGEYLDTGDIVQLECDTQCSFMLMTDCDFSRYQKGDLFNCQGGSFQRFPVRIAVPSTGHWNWVVDPGGGSADICCSVHYIRQR